MNELYNDLRECAATLSVSKQLLQGQGVCYELRIMLSEKGRIPGVLPYEVVAHLSYQIDSWPTSEIDDTPKSYAGPNGEWNDTREELCLRIASMTDLEIDAAWNY